MNSIPAAGPTTSRRWRRIHPKYLESGLAIVTDNNYCVKCHLIGDFSPGGNPKAMGPRLDRVHSRLRPDYLERWIGDPVRILPYTAMPVNIPPDKPVDQKLFAGSSQDQLNAVVDLLANFDRLADAQLSIKARVKPAARCRRRAGHRCGATPAKTDDNIAANRAATRIANNRMLNSPGRKPGLETAETFSRHFRTLRLDFFSARPREIEIMFAGSC